MNSKILITTQDNFSEFTIDKTLGLSEAIQVFSET